MAAGHQGLRLVALLLAMLACGSPTDPEPACKSVEWKFYFPPGDSEWVIMGATTGCVRDRVEYDDDGGFTVFWTCPCPP